MLVFYNVKDPATWVVNILVLLFVMYSRLYLAVHWPQDVVLGSVVGIVAGVIVCACNIHEALFNLVSEEQKNIAGGLIYLAVGFGYFILVWCFVKALNVVSNNNPCPDQAILRYKLGVLRSLRILKEDANDEKSKEASIMKKSESNKSNVAADEQYDIEDSDPEVDIDILTIDKSMWSKALMFMPKEERKKKETEDERKKREIGIFFPKDVKFDPDNKIRFWYNAINVFGAYCGMATFAVVDGREWMAFINWIEAVYATSFTFAVIVYTRTLLRSMLPKKVFKWVYLFVSWFVGFVSHSCIIYCSFAITCSTKDSQLQYSLPQYVFGLFPLSYSYVRKRIIDEASATGYYNL